MPLSNLTQDEHDRLVFTLDRCANPTSAMTAFGSSYGQHKDFDRALNVARKQGGYSEEPSLHTRKTPDYMPDPRISEYEEGDRG